MNYWVRKIYVEMVEGAERAAKGSSWTTKHTGVGWPSKKEQLRFYREIVLMMIGRRI